MHKSFPVEDTGQMNVRMVSPDGSSSRTRGRPRLLGRLGILGLLTGLICLGFRNPTLHKSALAGAIMIAVTIVGLTYVAWVVLRTRDMVVEPQALAPVDLWICRHSGPLAMAIAVGLFTFGILATAIADRRVDEPIWLTPQVIIPVVYFAMEVGFVLAMACLFSTRELRAARPILLWKASSLVLMLIYGLYVFLMPLSAVGSILGGW